MSMRLKAALTSAIARLPTVVWWNERDKHPVFNNVNGEDLVLRKDVLKIVAENETEDRTWYNPETTLPPDHREVLIELAPKDKRHKKRKFAVACYHRPLKGVHDDEEPGWFCPRSGDDVDVARWQYIDLVTGPV